MIQEHHQIIISAADESIARRAAIAIWRPELGIHRVPWGAPLARIAAGERFNALIAEMPGDGAEIGPFVREIRGGDSPSRRLGFIALVAPDKADAVMDHIGQGINRVVLTDRIDEDLETVLSELLVVAPRYAVGAPITLRPLDPRNAEESSCRIENASVTGILVSCRRELAPGSVIEFAVEGPDGAPPIRGRATVCRTTRPGLDAVTGFGARLNDFVGADRGRYETLLAQAG